ncbi:deoxyguanosinetriphosphate triphosphohydrolase [Serpentinicella sp. ANB-PHB4]|uniref:deoxyguanosinetriphosphate triphosphohydrolase n=1 Tax=Serpentinicella sp. ANB-PHB4 TaxID=3074076 RepID=UPI002861DF9C|nr:deoxyguanosinetriphosphate triphosphohydrolase [Serpentinicella sp. ANB-PHB4]MDR5657997.1 deoxyguanosinetriphosphate triphosphohydrolase [Serpentinicella sp. ANB-PHB4]
MDVIFRELTENDEKDKLASYAQLSKETVGRKKHEEKCNIRTCYQKDRDKIIHSESFRKLKGKTQVFIAKDDFFRTRLTHTLEVSQISRTIARALKLNEDLVEAIALGHDLGHTCFGHSGEQVLNQLTGCFRHNEQSLRVVDQLERKGEGLNLTYEVRDGILNHTRSGIPTTLEGKLVKIADRLTYLCHDIQDSISAGILKEKDIPTNIIETLGNSHSKRVNKFVNDIVNETINKINLGYEVDIYQSKYIEKITLQLREFMFKEVYNSEFCLKEKEKGTYIVKFLFNYFVDNIEKIPDRYKVQQNNCNELVVDYIATLTDNDAIRLYQNLIIPYPESKRSI